MTTTESKPETRYSWQIRNTRTGATCRYNSNIGQPVTTEHVAGSPAVKRWLNGDKAEIFAKA